MICFRKVIDYSVWSTVDPGLGSSVGEYGEGRQESGDSSSIQRMSSDSQLFHLTLNRYHLCMREPNQISVGSMGFVFGGEDRIAEVRKF